ncbi:hypothetical protein PAXRUDRAFT_22677 [Paxillus rubicundulus Ve08.2h10]|uniref:Uncharacterized protein n=1 Tax=Paxillus rubicundulus Ve08.2h10 TaxID=930991 RepID=A0A0D0BJR3_9AGAM|nr:hypothetical protein PAXRUDRAFT_22677 [Paxillus rubicundulus Ve08.2h10]
MDSEWVLKVQADPPGGGAEVPGPNIMKWASKPETWSEVVGNHKDSGKQQARKKVQERKSNGKDAQDANFKAKAQ